MAANVRRPILKCQHQCHRAQNTIQKHTHKPKTYRTQNQSSIMLENLNTKIRIGKCVLLYYVLDRVYWITQMPVLKRRGNEKHCRLGVHIPTTDICSLSVIWCGDASVLHIHSATAKAIKDSFSAPGDSSIVCWIRCFVHVTTFKCIVTFNVKKVYLRLSKMFSNIYLPVFLFIHTLLYSRHDANLPYSYMHNIST